MLAGYAGDMSVVLQIATNARMWMVVDTCRDEWGAADSQ